MMAMRRGAGEDRLRRDGRRFGRLFVRVEVDQLRRGHVFRPYGLLAAVAVVVPPTGLIAALTPLQPSAPAAFAVATILAVIVLPPLTALGVGRAAAWAEARLFRRADQRWLISTDSGWAGAYAQHVGQNWKLYAVCARPQGRGVGTALMGRICADADAAGASISLVAASRRAVAFYSTYGFRAGRRGLLGRHMRRGC